MSITGHKSAKSLAEYFDNRVSGKKKTADKLAIPDLASEYAATGSSSSSSSSQQPATKIARIDENQQPTNNNAAPVYHFSGCTFAGPVQISK
jgi:hypothetical protein